LKRRKNEERKRMSQKGENGEGVRKLRDTHSWNE